MANGDFIDAGRQGGVTYWQSTKLLDAAAGATDGVWIDVRGFPRMSLHITGTGTATLQLRGSNEVAKPANNTHGAQLGTDFTNPSADSMTAVDTAVRWIKVRISAYTNGTYSAFLNQVAQ